MSPAGSYSNASQSYIFNNAKTSCSYNVNYTVEFGYEIPIFDFGLPVKYNKPAHDSLIVYY